MLKNTLFVTATLSLALFGAACGGDKDGQTGDTAEPTGTNGGTNGGGNGTTPAGTGIDGFMAMCSGDDVTFDVGAFVDGTEAIVDFADTANAPGNYYEAHVVPPTSSGDGYTDFSLTIPSTGSYEAGVSTLFSCAADVHFEEATPGAIMTYGVRVYDGAGLADCMIVGEDYAGFAAGSYDDFGNTIQAADLNETNCEEGVWGM